MSAEPQSLSVAKEYARLGWHVFPLKPKMKVPLTAHGFYDATTNKKQIEEWFLMNPTAGVGIATGSPSKVIVLDIDPRNGGHETIQLLEARHGALPKTVEGQTGGGGRHLFFALPVDGVYPSAKPWTGVEIQGDGSYVVAPFSVHPSGLRYLWKDGQAPGEVEIAALPAWVLEALKARKASLVTDLKARPLKDEEKVIPEGKRDNTLTSFAGMMQRRGMSYESILRALLAENAARCVPPLPETDVLRIVRSVTRYAADPDADPGVPRETLVAKSIIFTDLSEIKKPDPISWILDERLAFGDVSLVVGPPASGKSWLTYEIAVAGSMGLPILGEFQPNRRLRVLLIDEENPQDEVMRRLWLLTQAWGIKPKELSECLMVSRACQGWSFREQGHCDALHTQIEQFKPDVVIFDSFVAVSTVKKEADATLVRQFFHDEVYPLRSICNSTMLFVHHTNKGVYMFERQGATAGLVRGSIDFVAVVDSLLMIESFETKKSKRHVHRLESVKVRRGKLPGLLHFELRKGADEGLRPVARHDIDDTEGGETSLGYRVRAVVLDVLQRQNGEPLSIERLKQWIEAAVPNLPDQVRIKTLQRMCSEQLISVRHIHGNGRGAVYFLGAQPPGESADTKS